MLVRARCAKRGPRQPCLPDAGKKPKKVTFVAIHSRRTDYLKYRQSQIDDTEELGADYYQDAMEHFSDEFGEDTTAFIFVSDDMDWAKNDETMQAEKNLFFEGDFIIHCCRCL